MSMSLSGYELERAVLDTMVPELVAEGYRVVIHPKRDMLPTFLRGYQPDMVAYKDNKNLAIEIKAQSPVARVKERVLRELGWEAAAFMGQLELLLADPTTRAALAATPGIGRILRPICRMLGVVMPVVAPVEVAAEVAPGVWPAAEVAGLPGVADECVASATSG
jgi:hypothetical protein